MIRLELDQTVPDSRRTLVANEARQILRRQLQ
jgi:hypothetical protein